MSKLKLFLIDLTIAAVLAVMLILVLDAADNMIRHMSLSFAEQITAAGMEAA